MLRRKRHVADMNERSKRRVKRSMALVLCLSLMFADTGCTGYQRKSENSTQSAIESGDEPASRDLFAMDTYMTITAYGEKKEQAVEAAVKEIQRLDKLLSAQDPDSEVAIVNGNGSEVLSQETGTLVRRSLDLYRQTDGLFDIAIYPLMQEWGFTTQEYKVPNKEKIEELLKKTDGTKIQYDNETRQLTLPDAMQIDLGGIAKGYTSSRIMEIFDEYGVTSGLVSLGGNVQAKGKKNTGENWRIGIQNPDKSSQDYLGILEISDRAVITSGGYERYFEQDGIVYHHILDPRTGYPADSGLTSVTIVSGDGTLADGLSTSLFIMGKEKALAYWHQHTKEFDVILLEKDGTLTITEGLENSFESKVFEIKVEKKEEDR